MKENFEFFLNAVHYMIYKEQVWSSKKIQKTVNYLISIIIKIPFIGKYKKENNEQELKELNKFYYGKNQDCLLVSPTISSVLSIQDILCFGLGCL